MKRNGAWFVRLALIPASTLVLALLVLPSRIGTRAQVNQSPVHLTTDWSNRHMIFSAPHSTIDGLKLQAQPRYLHQLLRRNAAAGRRIPSGQDQVQNGQAVQSVPDPTQRDWAVPLPAGATVGDGQFPAKFDFDITTPPDCLNDYVAFNTSLVGSSTSPSIVAFDELYSTQGSAGGFCNQDGPSVKWSYNTNPAGDNTGTVVTSPVISGDGTKVAFVETRTNANGGAILHVLKWKPGNTSTVEGTIAAPATPQIVASWGACPSTVSCVVNLTFNGNQPDTLSAPYYDYGSDILYVGDDNGVLHKFTGIFNSTPTEVTSGGWPITVNPGVILTGPVHDLVSNNVFVADTSGFLNYVQEVGSTVGSCVSGTPPCLGSGAQSLGGAIVDPPIVDGTNQTVFVFDGTASSGSATVLQTDTGLNVLQTVTVGNAGGLGIPMHAGIFDNAYFNSAFPNIQGNLLVCGKDPDGGDSPELYQIGFNSRSAVLNSTPNGSPLTGLAGGGVECSPVTEVFNTATSTDWIFFSVTGSGSPAACSSGGCVMSVNLTAAGNSWPPPAGIAAAAGATGGTSGITFDNVANTTTFPQASSIYFSYLKNAGGGGTPINVNNADFLSPPCNPASHAGCSLSVIGGDSIWWNPPPNGVPGWFPVSAGVVSSDPAIMGTVPDASAQVGYVAQGGGYYIQVLDGNCGGAASCPGGNSNVTLTAGVTYTVTVNVGSRTDQGATTGTLYIQATQNGPFTNLAQSIAMLSSGGQWITATVSYKVPSGSPVIGHNLSIALVAGGNQTLFNNVRVATHTSSCNGSEGGGCDVKLTQAMLN